MKPGSKKWRRRRQRFLENFHDHFIWITKFINLFRELWNLSPASWDKNMTLLLIDYFKGQLSLVGQHEADKYSIIQ